MEMGAERRSHPRIEKIHLVQLSRFDEEGFRADLATGRTLNISHGGLRLELHHALPLRSLVCLSLALGDEILEVDGRVSYLEVLDDERNAIGIEFIELTPAEQQRIDAFLAAGHPPTNST